MKVVINSCFGGFGLSWDAIEYCATRGLDAAWCLAARESKEKRCHPILVEAVETLGKAASREMSNLTVVTIPLWKTSEWEIEDYDGFESIHESHSSWG